MIKEYIYMSIPAKWKVIYDKLLLKMAELGTDLLVECNASCKGIDKEYIACWNMFQAACAAYELKQYSKADILIKFIKTKLNITDEELSPIIVYYGQSDTFDIEEFKYKAPKNHCKYILETHKILSTLDNILKINQTKHYHFVLVNDDITFEGGSYGSHTLKTIIDYKKYENVIINNINYTLYLYYSPVGAFDEKITLKFK